MRAGLTRKIITDRNGKRTTVWVKTGGKKPTYTKDFKAWFKGSKVVDNKGEPLVVYHGSRANVVKPFTVFKTGDAGAWFSSNKHVAGWFSGNSQRISFEEVENPFTDKSSLQDMEAWYKKNVDPTAEVRAYKDNGEVYQYRLEENNGNTSSPLGSTKDEAMAKMLKQVQRGVERLNYPSSRPFYEVYLSLKNPYVINAKGKSFFKVKYNGKTYAAETIAEHIKKEGIYDGLIIKNVVETTQNAPKSDIYIVFKSTQIKSATGNKGTFDAKNPDITKGQ